MTTQKRKIQEIPPTSAAVAVEDPSAGKAESVETPDGNRSADQQSAVVAAGPDGTESTVPASVPTTVPTPVPATVPDTDADTPADDASRAEPQSDTGKSDTGTPIAPAESADHGGPTEPVAPSAVAGLTELTALTERISALEEAFALQQQAIADVGASVTGDIADLAGTVALEVERVTTDELVDAKRNLSMAAHSMAHLALGITESADNVTGELGPDSIIALLHSFRAEVDNVLLQLGFTPLDTRVGDKFDPNRHRSLRRIPTDDVSMDRLIARVIRDGYRSENTKRILVYSDVEVHRYHS